MGNDIYHIGKNMLLLNNMFDEKTQNKLYLEVSNVFIFNCTNLNVSTIVHGEGCAQNIGCPIGHHFNPALNTSRLSQQPPANIARWQDIICLPCELNHYQDASIDSVTGTLPATCIPCAKPTSTNGEMAPLHAHPANLRIYFQSTAKLPF